jgi:hypothetical protein
VSSWWSNPTFRECIQTFSPIASTAVAVSAVGVAIWLGKLQRAIQEGQRQIQEAQLKNALYDRRFSVYAGSLRYMTRLMQMNGAVESSDLEKYVPEVELGELLFGEEVRKFLVDLRELGINLYVMSREAAHLDTMQQESTAKHLEVGEMMKELTGRMMERRTQVFRPYLKLV